MATFSPLNPSCSDPLWLLHPREVALIQRGYSQVVPTTQGARKAALTELKSAEKWEWDSQQSRVALQVRPVPHAAPSIFVVLLPSAPGLRLIIGRLISWPSKCKNRFYNKPCYHVNTFLRFLNSYFWELSRSGKQRQGMCVYFYLGFCNRSALEGQRRIDVCSAVSLGINSCPIEWCTNRVNIPGYPAPAPSSLSGFHFVFLLFSLFIPISLSLLLLQT